MMMQKYNVTEKLPILHTLGKSHACMCQATLDTVQDFLFKLDMKPQMYQVEISIFSLNIVTVRPTKVMNRADKIGHIFTK